MLYQINSSEISSLAKDVVQQYTKLGLTIGAAESCTGGMLASAITSIPGSSIMFHYGCVTYSNRAKCELLGLDKAMLERYKAVSSEVASAMAEAIINKAWANVGIGITGVAGPDAVDGAEVGCVYIGIASDMESKNLQYVQRYNFHGVRAEIQAKATIAALVMLLQIARD